MGRLILITHAHTKVEQQLRAFLLGEDRAHFSDWQQLPFAAVAIYDLAVNQLVQDFTAVLEASPRGL